MHNTRIAFSSELESVVKGGLQGNCGIFLIVVWLLLRKDQVDREDYRLSAFLPSSRAFGVLSEVRMFRGAGML